MKIDDIVGAKGREVTAVSHDAKLGDVARVMRDKRIGSVLVRNAKGQTVGIVTERVLVEAMAASSTCAETTTATSVMVTPPPTIQGSDDLYLAMRQMTTTRNRHLVVMTGNEVAGVVSIGDLVKVRMRDMELENGVLRDIARANLSR